MADIVLNNQVKNISKDITNPSPMQIADELLDTLYSGETKPEDYAEAHHVWLTWFMRQSHQFKRRAVARYRARREQAFESMYGKVV